MLNLEMQLHTHTRMMWYSNLVGHKVKLMSLISSCLSLRMARCARNSGFGEDELSHIGEVMVTQQKSTQLS